MSDWYKKRWQAQRATVKAAKAALKEERRLHQITKETNETLRGHNGRLEVMASVGWSVIDAYESIRVAIDHHPLREAK